VVGTGEGFYYFADRGPCDFALLFHADFEAVGLVDVREGVFPVNMGLFDVVGDEVVPLCDEEDQIAAEVVSFYYDFARFDVF
jgi:hypothetical protein